ncbi:MAG: hypothetical protein RJA25_826 [Bacteroidota bacterium]|jgi:anaerobic magnesium-protoporphyrin IX monomethyl ester cyclase
MRILLATLNSKYIHTNLAIRLLYQLNKKYENLEWKEFTINEDKDSIAEACSSYDIIAFSCYIWNITPTLEVARKIKTLHPSIKILLGGPEVSFEWETIMAQDCVDFIIAGEGEVAFQQFLESYPSVQNVPSLVYKQEGVVKENKPAPMFDVTNYQDILPYAADDISVLHHKVLYIETSRGCPYKCEFCLASIDNTVRYLPNEAIKKNLLFLMQHGRVIKFLDRTFNIKKNFTIDIFQFILDNRQPNNVFQFEITADIVHPDIIQFIHEKVTPGIFRFEIGIQTVNQKANLAVSRKQNFEKTRDIILQIADKIEMHLDLIVGLPLDYFEDIKYSFEEVFKIFAPELQLGFLKFLKGTPMRDKQQLHDFVFDKNPPYQIIESKYLSKNELAQIVLLEHALEIYWNKKRTINTLKYVTQQYSIFDFLLELGTYFSTQKSLFRYTLKEVYEVVYQFVINKFPNDTVLRELIAIDYYTQHKLKPSSIFIEERRLNEEQKKHILKSIGIPKGRIAALPIGFDWKIFKAQNKIVPKETLLAICYNATTLSEAIIATE